MEIERAKRERQRKKRAKRVKRVSQIWEASFEEAPSLAKKIRRLFWTDKKG